MSVVTPLPTWTLREWDDDRTHTERSVELVRGVPIVSPGEPPSNRRIVDRVVATLNAKLPPGWFAVSEVELTIHGGTRPTVRRPDVVVLPETAPLDRPRQNPQDVALVCEVVSPTSRERDWMTKVDEYARAGVCAYLVVDPGQDALGAFVAPENGAYTARADDGAGTADVDLGGRPVRVSLSEVLSRPA